MDASFDKKKFKSKFDYYTGKAADIADPKLQAKAQDYKRRLSGAFRAISGQDIGRVPAGKGTFVSRKYDGEFAFVVFDGENAISLHPSGTVRSGLPCLNEAEAKLKKAKVKSCILAAEYYLLDTAAESRSLEQVLGVLRNPSSKKELDRLALAVFDVVELDGKPQNATAVFADLDKWFGKGKNVHPVEHKPANKSETIMETYVDWVIGEGAEGIVVRNDKGDYYKVKLRHNLDVAVIGFSEGTENRKGLLHDLLVAVVRPDGTFQELTRVGGGFSEADRKEFLKDLKKLVVPSEYV